MTRNWLWDRDISSRKLKKIFGNINDPAFTRWAAVLLSRNNVPREVFSKYIQAIDFCRCWNDIKKIMRRDKWNDPRIDFWQAIYEGLLAKYRREGTKVFISKKKKTTYRICKEVGNDIKMLRKRKGLTQKMLAEKLKVSQQLISRIESGYENISLLVLDKIAKQLGVIVKVGIN